MRFQPVKCNMMQIRKQIKKIHASYTLEGTVLKMSKTSSIFGSLSQMIYNGIHISNVCTKANWTLGFPRRNLYACPQEVKEAIYKGLVRPILEYSGSVWDPSGVGLQNELEKVQNRTGRFVTGNYNFETGSMTGILEHLKWESLKKLRRDSRLILLYEDWRVKPVYQQMTLSLWLGVAGMIILWHIRFPLLTLILISVAFSPRQ